MSLIIGIRCIDGIVVGSDSAATFGSMGQSTIRQTAKKIQRPTNDIICAVAGTAGLSQMFNGCIRELSKRDGFRDLERHDMMSNIGSEFLEYVKPLLIGARLTKEHFGKVAYEEAVAQALIAMPVGNDLALFSFDEKCAPEEITEDLAFVSLGGGRAIADPFLAFIKRVVWKDKMPALSTGIFSAVWTLEHAIKTNAFGVAGPIQIVTLTTAHGTPIIQDIDTGVYAEHVELAEGRVASLSEILDISNTSDDQGTSPIPLSIEFTNAVSDE